MIERIYDPNNVMFEVPAARAGDLILNHGWTRQPTTTVPVEAAPEEDRVEDDWRLSLLSPEEAEQEPERAPIDASDPEDNIALPKRRRTKS